MKKWKCPECEVLTDFVKYKLEGYAIGDVDGDVKMGEWECDVAYCEECGFEESYWTNIKFEVVEIEG